MSELEDQQTSSSSSQCAGSIVVVAKCPIPSKSKTRLIPLFGEQGAANLAKAMLCDVLTNLSSMAELESVHKILLFAPSSGESIMLQILRELALESEWKRIPMIDGNDLQSADLGYKLTQALIEARKLTDSNGPVIFLGMDSPELPLDEIQSAIHQYPSEALLCPANDGGYGMLSVPPQVSAERVFNPLSRGERWSTPLTAIAQAKALTDNNVRVIFGRLMYDMDEPHDVAGLCQRLRNRTSENQFTNPLVTAEMDCLLKPSSSRRPQTGDCKYTLEELVKLGQM